MTYCEVASATSLLLSLLTVFFVWKKQRKRIKRWKADEL